MTAEQPPRVSRTPLVGDAIAAVREGGAFYERAAAVDDVVRLRLPLVGEPVLVSHPDLVERVLRSEADRFPKADFVREQLDDLLGRGLIQSGGDPWARRRRLLAPAFAADRIEAYEDVMVAEAERLAGEWSPGDRIDVDATTRRLTLRVLFDALFGVPIDEWEDEVVEALRAVHAAGRLRNQPVAQLVPKWVPIGLWRRYREGVETLDRVVRAVIDRRADAASLPDDPADGEDLLSILLAAERDGRIDREGVRDEVITFLFAAHETTATVLTFVWYLLARNPDVERRVHREVDSVLGDRPPDHGDLEDLEVVDRVVRETMRLYPQVPNLFRAPTEDVTLGGYHVPAGTIVIPSIWAIHRDGRWYDEPRAFRPTRWTGDREDALPACAYLPFGGGPRRCIGAAFARAEARLILATVARGWSLELVSDSDLDLSLTITTRPESDVECVVRRRSDRSG